MNEPEIKIHMLDLLARSLNIATSDSLSEQQLSYLAERSEAIQAFFKKALKQSDDVEVARYALLQIPLVLPPDENKSILNDMAEAFFLPGKDTSDYPISLDEYVALWFEVALSTPNNQKEMLAAATALINRSSAQGDENPLRDKILSYINATEISADARPTVEALLNTLKPSANGDASYFHWLTAYASTKVERSEINRYIVNNLFATSALEQTSIINYGGDELLNSMSNEQLTSAAGSIIDAYSKIPPSTQAQRAAYSSLLILKPRVNSDLQSAIDRLPRPPDAGD